MPAALPLNETERLQALESYSILDSVPEIEFDQLVELAAQICQVPISLISLIDKDRQWFKARFGLAASETPREHAFCAYAIHERKPFIVPNALEDKRFQDNPLVTDNPNIRFYAGLPLIDKSGYALGTICVIDNQPRELNAEQIRALEILSHQAIQLLEQRLYLLKQQEIFIQVQEQYHALQKMHQFNVRMLRIFEDEFEDPMSELAQILKQTEQESTEALSRHEILTHFLQLEEIRQAMDYLVRWQDLQLNPACPDTPHSCEFSDIVKKAIQSVQPLAAETNNTLRLSDFEPEIWVQANRSEFKFILEELLRNSCNHSSGQYIDVQIDKQANHVQLKICNQGRNFTASQLSALQHQAAPPTTSGQHYERGLGLGLMICQRYAARWGAQLQFKNIDQGVSVELVLLTTEA